MLPRLVVASAPRGHRHKSSLLHRQERAQRPKSPPHPRSPSVCPRPPGHQDPGPATVAKPRKKKKKENSPSPVNPQSSHFAITSRDHDPPARLNHRESRLLLVWIFPKPRKLRSPSFGPASRRICRRAGFPLAHHGRSSFTRLGFSKSYHKATRIASKTQCVISIKKVLFMFLVSRRALVEVVFFHTAPILRMFFPRPLPRGPLIRIFEMSVPEAILTMVSHLDSRGRKEENPCLLGPLPPPHMRNEKFTNPFTSARPLPKVALGPVPLLRVGRVQ